MTVTELVPLLTGTAGALVLSLTVNYAFFRGWILNPRHTIRREDYDATLAITERNTMAIEKLAGRKAKR